MARTLDSSPYLDFDRETWRELRKSMPQVLTETEVEKLRGLGDRIDLDEVADVYLPLSRLIHMQLTLRKSGKVKCPDCLQVVLPDVASQRLPQHLSLIHI